MAKTELTEQLERAISLVTSKIGVFGCFEVTIGFYGEERVDYITLDTKGVWRCYEIKTSLSDFRSKAKKSFVGHYNYYVMTEDLYEKVKDEIPSHVGVYVGEMYLKCVKKSKKQELEVEEEVLKMSLIRSLYRDSQKLHRLKNPKALNKLNNRISKLEKEKFKYKDDLNDLKSRLRKKFGRNWQDVIEEDNKSI